MTLNYPLLTDSVDCRRFAADPEVKESEIDFSRTCYPLAYMYMSSNSYGLCKQKRVSQCITWLP